MNGAIPTPGDQDRTLHGEVLPMAWTPDQTATLMPQPNPAALPVNYVIRARIGDIVVTDTHALTPFAAFPLAGTHWSVADRWLVEQRTPTWAVVCAVAGFFCLTVFSLLFLLARETRVSGAVEVTIRYGNQVHTAYLPVTSHAAVGYVHQLVNWASSLGRLPY
jgi:hypothetical protein